MDEQRIIGHRILYQPMHGAKDIGLGRHAHGIMLIISQNHHILSPIAIHLIEENRHLRDIVDAAFQLIGLPEIVDTNQQRFPPSGAIGIAELVAGRRPVAECLGRLRRRGR